MAIATVTWPQKVKDWADWAVTPEQIRLLGLIGVCVGLGYLVLLLWLKPTSASDRPALINQRSRDGSHNIGQVGGSVFINSSAAPSTESPRARPDMPMWEAVKYISPIIGDSDIAHCYPETRRQIRQAALDGRIEISGREEILPETKTSPVECREVWSPISRNYWAEFKIIETATSSLLEDRDHTFPDPFVPQYVNRRYWSLLVRKDEVEREWPDPSKGIDRKIRIFPSGPNAWMSG